jgi:hypothetical protein
MKTCLLAILLSLITTKSFSQTEIDILVACAPEDHADFIFNSSDFLYFLNADGALGEGGVKLASKKRLKVSVSMHGDTSILSSEKPQILKLNIARLQDYLDWRNSKENPFPELKTPKNIGEVLQEFREMTNSGCDFLIPTRLYTMLTTLKPTTVYAQAPLLTKPEEDLAMCKAKLELCSSQNPGVIGTLDRESQKVSDQINKGSSLKSGATSE